MANIHYADSTLILPPSLIVPDRRCLHCSQPIAGRALHCAACKAAHDAARNKAWRMTEAGRASRRQSRLKWRAANLEHDKALQSACQRRYVERYPDRVAATIAKSRGARKPKGILLPSVATLAYPYIATARAEHSDVLAIVRLVPSYVADRDDICQDIMLAILEGRASLAELQSDPRKLSAFYSKHRAGNYEGRGYAVSLSEPRRDGRSWNDVLSADMAMTG